MKIVLPLRLMLPNGISMPRIRQDTGLFAALGRRVLTKTAYKDGSPYSMDDSQKPLFNIYKNGVEWT